MKTTTNGLLNFIQYHLLKNWFMFSVRVSSMDVWMHAGSLESTKKSVRVARGGSLVKIGFHTSK